MSLVNYSSDEEEEEEEEEKEERQQLGVSQLASSTPSSSTVHASGSLLATRQDSKLQANFSSTMVETSLKLPDASQLFVSFDSVKENTVVNLSGGALSSKKRSDLNGSADAPLKKIPKGGLMPVRTVPDTAGGSLLPPQLRGRSNIATEDLDKLFTRKPKKSFESAALSEKQSSHVQNSPRNSK